MEQINIKVSDAASKQAFMDLIENWRNGDESNGDVFNRIVAVAAATGQKPIEVSQHLGIVRNTVDTLMHQINSCVSANLTTISDLKTQLSEKDEKIEELDTDYKKKLLQMGDAHREKIEKLKTNIDELKDWLAVATQSKAQAEKQLKDANVALESCQDNLNDKKTLIDKLNNDLNEKNKKIVELQQVVDGAQEHLKATLASQSEKHQAELSSQEDQHQKDLEQERIKYEGIIQNVKSKANGQIDQILAEQKAVQADLLLKQQEDMHEKFENERKELLNKLDKKQELLDNLKDQLAATRENNAVLKQQLSQFTQQG